MKRHLLLLSLVFVVIGCQKGNPANQVPESAADISADDRAQREEIRMYVIEIPVAREGQQLCIAFFDHEGMVESRACPPDVQEGDLVELFLSAISTPTLRLNFLVGTIVHNSTILNHFNDIDGPMTAYQPGRRVVPGDYLIKKSNTNSVSGTDSPLEEGELAITLIFQDDAQP